MGVLSFIINLTVEKWGKELNTMMHWGLDVHTVDRYDSSMFEFHCHVFKRGQTEGHRARAHSLLVISTL